MNAVILIPAYNAEATLSDLCEEIRRYSDLPIILVDDGSRIPVSQLSLDSSVKIHRIAENLGKGNALRSGIDIAETAGFSHVLTMDADFQHCPEDITKFLSVDPQTALVIGCRDFSAPMPVHRRLSNVLTSWILSIRCGFRILDSQCGFRRYCVEVFSGSECVENGFQFESEVLIRNASRLKKSVAHVSVKTIYNSAGSSIKNSKDTVKFINLLMRSLFWRTG